MRMFGLNGWHLLAIAIVAFIIFGPKHLPQLGKAIAKAVRDLRSGMREVSEEFHEEFENSPAVPANAQPVAASAPATPAAAASETSAVAAATPAPAGPFCIHCGAANLPESRFCHQCGQQLVEKIA